MHNSCFRRSQRARAIRQGVKLALYALTALVCVPTRLPADNAPDWLRAAAQQKLSPYPDNPIAVILLDELQITVQSNGEVNTRHRLAYKLLRPEAQDRYGYASVNFDNETKVTSFKAWTILANGTELSVGEKDALETSLATYEVFTDDKAKVLRFPGAAAGTVVGYEYVRKERPFLFENAWMFQDPLPVKRARLSLQLPSGWDFSARWFNYPDQKPQSSGANQSSWEVQDLPAVDIEPGMPVWKAVGGWMGLKYFPHDPAQRVKTMGSWTDLGTWYAGLAQAQRAPSPQIQQKVSELISGVTDPAAKMLALARYIQQKIRYVAIEIGVGGYQPHAAADIFQHQYGDCKDKATLLATMLHEIGIESYYVLVDTNRGIVRPDYPSMNFDHVVLAIRLPDTINAAPLYAVMNHPKLGRLLFFDPTDEYVPPGYLPASLQHNYGLLVTPDGGELVPLPLLTPATNRLLRTAKFSLSATGNLSGDVQELLWGGPASDQRAAFLETQPSKRAQIFEGFLSSSVNDFTLTSGTIANLEQYDQSLILGYKFFTRGYANSTGDLLLVRPRVLGDKYTWLLRLFAEQKPRKYPIEFDEATRQDDLFDITLPAGYVVDGLPEPVQASCDYASYRSETKVADGVLHYKRTFEIKDVLVPTEKLGELRTFLQQVAADQEAAAVLRRAAP